MPTWVDKIEEAHVGYDTDYLVEAFGGPKRDQNGRFIKGSGSPKRPSRPSVSSAPSVSTNAADKKPNRKGFIRWLINKAKSALKYVGGKIGGRRALDR